MKNHNRDPKNPYAPIFDPSRPNEEIPDEVLMILLTVYGTALVIALSVCGCCIYFCRKNNAESKKTKKRMQELQMMFAQSQNINVHQMNAQPNFPRTIHIWLIWFSKLNLYKIWQIYRRGQPLMKLMLNFELYWLYPPQELASYFYCFLAPEFAIISPWVLSSCLRHIQAKKSVF